MRRGFYRIHIGQDLPMGQKKSGYGLGLPYQDRRLKVGSVNSHGRPRLWLTGKEQTEVSN
jgi:hypothetical protein